MPCRTPLGAPHHNCWEHDAVQPTSQGRVIGQPAKDNKTLFLFYFLNLAACTFSDFLSHHHFFNIDFSCLLYTHTSLVFVPTLSPLNRRSRPALALLTDACPTATTRPQTAARPQNLPAQTTTSTSKTSHSTIFHFEKKKKEKERNRIAIKMDKSTTAYHHVDEEETRGRSGYYDFHAPPPLSHDVRIITTTHDHVSPC